MMLIVEEKTHHNFIKENKQFCADANIYVQK